jgi:hypothetical protein
MQLDLTPNERNLIEAILAGALGELREGVYHAEEHSFKDGLKADESTLRSILLKVRALPWTAGS